MVACVANCCRPGLGIRHCRCDGKEAEMGSGTPSPLTAIALEAGLAEETHLPGIDDTSPRVTQGLLWARPRSQTTLRLGTCSATTQEVASM